MRGGFKTLPRAREYAPFPTHRFTDVCCDYNAFWRRVPNEIDLWAADGWNYELFLVTRLLRAGRDVRELGYPYRGRLRRDSKLPSWRQGLGAVWVLARERFRRRGRRLRGRVA